MLLWAGVARGGKIHTVDCLVVAVCHCVGPKLYLVGVAAAVAVPAVCLGRYGLRGFYEREDKPITLTRHSVDGIHLKGGTMLVSYTLIHSR